jgi:hypothetical protein
MNLQERIQLWLENTVTEDVEILMAENLLEAFIGLQVDGTDTVRAVYDADKILSILVREGMTYEDALEYYEFNISGAYVGPGTPIFINRFPEA